MSGYNIDIADMQCWVFRMAQSKWKMSPTDCAELELFKKYNIRILNELMILNQKLDCSSGIGAFLYLIK